MPFSLLISDVPPNDFRHHLVPNRPDKVSVVPQLPSPQVTSQQCKFLKHLAGRQTLHNPYHLRNLPKDLLQSLAGSVHQDILAVLRCPDKVISLGYKHTKSVQTVKKHQHTDPVLHRTSRHNRKINISDGLLHRQSRQ